MSKEVVDEFRGRRYTDALAELCMERGYRAVTVADVVARAHTSRDTFYRQFASKDAAFVALLERASEELLERVEGSCGHGAYPARLRPGVDATLSWVAEDPAAAHVLFTEAVCGHEPGLAIQAAAIGRLVALLKMVSPAVSSGIPRLNELLIDGLVSILRCKVINGEAKQVPKLAPSFVRFLEQPYLSD